MTRTRNSKGQLEDYGHREVEVPKESDTPGGWVRADGTYSYAPSSDITFDRAGRPAHSLQPLSGQAAITTIFRFFNLHALEKRQGLTPDKQVEKLHLQVQLQDPKARGLRDWMRLPVDVEVLVGPSKAPGRMVDLGAGGIRIEQVHGRFMVGRRMDVVMPYAIGVRRGNIVFATRVAWSNDMRHTLGLEFTAAPKWHED